MATRGLSATPLLERASELEAIDAAMITAKQGIGAALLLEGSAGLGKTRLMGATAARAREAGMAVLSARGSELEREFAWGVARQLFERLLSELPEDERRSLLSDAADWAAPALGLAPGGGGAPDASFSTLHGLYWLTANLARRGPLLVAVDDLHWSDGPSLRFLAFLTTRLEGLPLVLALAARPREAGTPAAQELLTQLGADPSVGLVKLAPLTSSGSAQLVRGEMGDSASEEFCSACHEMSGGNPFLLRELVGELAQEGVVPTAEAAERVQRTAPDVVRRSVLLRLARTSAEAVALARAVAILGPRAYLGRAARLAGIGDDAAADAAGTLIAATILDDDPELTFVHPLLRAAVLEDIGATEQARWHRRSAELLEEEGASAEDLAPHVLATAPSGNTRAVSVLREAAALAQERAAPDVATAYLRRALLEPPNAATRLHVLLELGASEAVGDPQGACAHLGEAVELADDGPQRAAASLELGRAMTMCGRFADAVPVLESAIASLGDADAALQAALDSELMNATRWELPTRPRSYAVLRRIEERAARTNSLDPRLHAQLAVEMSAAGRDRGGAVDHARRAMAESERMAPEGSATLPQALSVLVHANLLKEAQGVASRLLRQAQQRGWPLTTAIMATCCALVAINAGAVSDAVAYAHEALSPIAEGWIPPFGVAFLVEGLLQRGDFETARAELVRRGLDRDLPPAWQFTPLLFFRGRLSAAEGDHERALADLLHCGELCDAWGVENPAFLQWRSSAALSLVARGQRDEALSLARAEVERARVWGTSAGIGIAMRALGNAESDGTATLRSAVSELERSEAPLDLAYALVDLGARLRREGERSEAREHLRRGLDLAHRQGALPLAERAREELVVAGGRPRRDALRGRDALTPSELRVARMAASGLTNRQIAQALFVTLRTVELHLTSTYGKLGIRSRGQLAEALAA